MKKITIVLFALFAASSLFLTSCFEKPTITPPNVSLGLNAPSTTQLITKTSAVGTFSMSPTSFHLNMDSTLKANGVTGALKSVNINNIKFEVVSGAPNFDFLTYINSTLSIGGTNQTFNSANPIPTSSTSFLIDGKNFDLEPYIAQNIKDFIFSYSGANSQPILQDVSVKITLTFTIVAAGS